MGLRSMMWGIDYSPDGTIWYTEEASNGIWQFAIDTEEYKALPADDKDVMRLYAQTTDFIDPNDPRVEADFQMFAPDSKSKIAFDALKTETVSDLAIWELPVPTEHEVDCALGRYIDPMIDPKEVASPGFIAGGLMSDEQLAKEGFKWEDEKKQRLVRV